MADLPAVAAQQLHEASLRTGGALAAQQRKRGDAVLDFLKIHVKLVEPQGRTLTHGGQLRRLQMRVGQSRQVLVPLSEAREQVHDVEDLAPDDFKALLHDDHVGIVAHVAAGGPQMDDAARLGALQAVGIDMAHHVMAALALAALGVVVVDVVLVSLQLGDLLVGDGQALLLLSPRQGDPQPPPGAELVVLGKDELHLRACVPGGKGADIPGMIGHGDVLLRCKIELPG